MGGYKASRAFVLPQTKLQRYIKDQQKSSSDSMIWYDIYLTAIGLTPGGSITRHIYNKQYTKYIESTILEVLAVPRLCE